MAAFFSRKIPAGGGGGGRGGGAFRYGFAPREISVPLARDHFWGEIPGPRAALLRGCFLARRSFFRARARNPRFLLGSPGEKPFAIPSTSTKRNPRESAKSPQENRKNPQMKEPECHRKRSFSAGSGSRFGGSWGIHAGPGPGMVPGPAARRPERERSLAGPGIHSGPRPGRFL